MLQKTVVDGAPSDQAARDAAADVTSSCIVEAPAGSGKTGLLILRYLKLLSLPDVQQPEQVLAITFTIKAAGEIRDRVLRELGRANEPASSSFEVELRRYAATVLERSRQMGWNLLEHPERMNLRTIDSVCAEIARSMPLLAGGSGLRPVEEASTLYGLAAERTLLHLGGGDSQLSDSLKTILLHRDGDLERCRNLLAEMLSLRDQWGRLLPLQRHSLEDAFLDREILPRLERSLRSVIVQQLQAAEAAFPQTILRRLAAVAANMALAEGYRGEASPITVCAHHDTSPSSAVEDLDRWRALIHLLLNQSGEWRKRRGLAANHLRFTITPQQKSELGDILDHLSHDEALLKQLLRIRNLPPPLYPQEQWHVSKALFHVLHHALVELQLVFAERGECDFIELGLQARSALRHEAVALDLATGARLQHLLVDEMQDTSTSQYELIDLLTQGWDGHSQTVFLVGDPKQSIYLFRQARVERFLQTMRHRQIGAIPLVAHYLQANFRSQHGLVASFNAAFGEIFTADPARDDEDAIRYLPAQASREPLLEDSLNTVWHPQVRKHDSDSPERETLIEAEGVRDVIARWRKRPLPAGRVEPWKIAVLVRSRSHLTRIIAALKQEVGEGPIPFRAVDIDPLSERPEVLDLYALTRALRHPADRVAWLAILRAPWCGLELADLHLLCGEDAPQWSNLTIPELIAERGSLLHEEAFQRLQHVGDLMQAAREQSSRLQFAELVERTWHSLTGEEYLTPEAHKNAALYLSLLDTLDQQDGRFDLQLLQERLSRLFAEPAAVDNAVELMTIHGAKGLEWDVVLVPGLERSSTRDEQRLLTWEEMAAEDASEASVLLAPIPGKGEASSELNQWLRRLHKEREEAECKRLFYVACTRAREELHLFATVKLKSDGSTPQIRERTLLKAAWPAAKSHFCALIEEIALDGAKVLSFPVAGLEDRLPALAASAADPKNTGLARLPLKAIRRLPVTGSDTTQEHLAARIPVEDRLTGSFEKRAFGSTVHELLELLTRLLAEGRSPADLIAEVSLWSPRTLTLLRSRGLPLANAQRCAPLVLHALLNTLNDPEGLWLLEQQLDAASEIALTAWTDDRASVRMDRIFRAGPAPQEAGEQHLWILDFKTAYDDGADAEDFFQRERSKYKQQLERYAQILRQDRAHPEPLRVGLYYPLLPRLIWWEI